MTILICVILAFLSGCAEVTRPTPTVSEIETCQLAATARHPYKTWSLERVSRVFLKLLITVPQVHGRTYPFLGFDWWCTETGKIVIDNVWQPSPAYEAGLRQGDLILGLHNWPVDPAAVEWQQAQRLTRDLMQDFLWVKKTAVYPRTSGPEILLPLTVPGEVLVALLLDLQHVAMEMKGRYLAGPVPMLVQREGEKKTLTLYPQHLPTEYAILVDTNDRRVNAYAAPGRIILSLRLVRFCLNDHELAVIIGHELAHHAKGHLVRGTGHRRLAGLVGAMWRFAGLLATYPVERLLNWRQVLLIEDRKPSAVQDAVVSVFSREDEREADIYGLWFAYQAGYDLDRGLAVLERLAGVINDPFEQTYFLDDHPAPLERLARLKRVARYFRAGRAAEVFLQSPDLDRKPISENPQ